MDLINTSQFMYRTIISLHSLLIYKYFVSSVTIQCILKELYVKCHTYSIRLLFWKTLP